MSLLVANKSWWWFYWGQRFNLVSNIYVLEYILISWTSEYRGFLSVLAEGISWSRDIFFKGTYIKKRNIKCYHYISAFKSFIFPCFLSPFHIFLHIHILVWKSSWRAKDSVANVAVMWLSIFSYKTCLVLFLYYFFLSSWIRFGGAECLISFRSLKNFCRCFVSQEGIIGIFMNILPETNYIVLFLLCHLHFVSMCFFPPSLMPVVRQHS